MNKNKGKKNQSRKIATTTANIAAIVFMVGAALVVSALSSLVQQEAQAATKEKATTREGVTATAKDAFGGGIALAEQHQDKANDVKKQIKEDAVKEKEKIEQDPLAYRVDGGKWRYYSN